MRSPYCLAKSDLCVRCPFFPVVGDVESVLGRSLSSEKTVVPHDRKWRTRRRADGQGALYPSSATYAVALAKLLDESSTHECLHPDRLLCIFSSAKCSPFSIAARTTPGTRRTRLWNHPPQKSGGAVLQCSNSWIARTIQYSRRALPMKCPPCLPRPYSPLLGPLRCGNEPVASPLNCRNQIFGRSVARSRFATSCVALQLEMNQIYQRLCVELAAKKTKRHGSISRGPRSDYRRRRAAYVNPPVTTWFNRGMAQFSYPPSLS